MPAPKAEPNAVQTSLSDLVVVRVREGIQAGRYAPGQRVFERDLMDELNVGRGSVREALRLLVADGIVEITPHRGAAIKQFTRDEVWALHEIREVLEGLAASLAASRVKTSDQRTALLNLEKGLVEAARDDDRDRYQTLNSELHTLIVEMGGNSCLNDMIDRAHATALRLQTGRFLDRQLMAQRSEEHRSIIEAIINGDAVEAERRMRDHVRSSRSILLKLPDFVFAKS